MFRETKIASPTPHSGTTNQSISPLRAKSRSVHRDGAEHSFLLSQQRRRAQGGPHETLKRSRKKSFNWYKKVIESNGKDLSS